MYAEIFAVIAPIFCCALLGWGWARSGQSYDSALISSLVMNIGAPCLIIATLGRVSMTAQSFSQILLATLLILLSTMLLAVLLCRSCGLSVRAFLPVLSFPNTGNMGLPLCLFAFGEEGLAVALAYFTVVSLVHFSVGVALVSGSRSLWRSVNTPIVYAALVSIVLIYSGLRLPDWLQNTLSLLGDFSIPLMLITLGVSLSRLRVADLALGTGLALARLLIGLGVGCLVVELLALEGVVRAVIILQSAMPAAVFNYLLAQRFERNQQQVAGVVVISTLLGFLLLPLLLWLVW